MNWLIVGMGGALGAMARHALTAVVLRVTPSGAFPLGIFLVNVIGSAAIGLLAGVIAGGRMHVSPEWRLFLIVGVLGGFTTFSSFSLDTLTLVKGGHLGLAVWNVVGQVTVSLLAVLLGYRAGAALH
jgi:CrcB protein